jgi:hypothetical protein
MGASDGTNAGSSLWIDDDANTAQRVRHSLATSLPIRMVTQNGTTHTQIANADAIFQTDNLRFSWTAVNATARRYAYVALGSADTSVSHLAAATVAAVSTVTAIATVAHLAAATIAAVSTVAASATAVIHHQAQATVNATSSVVAIASVSHLAQAIIGATSSVSAEASVAGSGDTDEFQPSRLTRFSARRHR